MKGQVTRGVVSFTETDEVGLYTLTTSRGQMKVAVNLTDAEESNLVPRPLPPPAAGGPPRPRCRCRSSASCGSSSW